MVGWLAGCTTAMITLAFVKAVHDVCAPYPAHPSSSSLRLAKHVIRLTLKTTCNQIILGPGFGSYDLILKNEIK